MRMMASHLERSWTRDINFLCQNALSDEREYAIEYTGDVARDVRERIIR